ncbi:MAG TPA: SIS domain-containing protein [Candidatus Limnocylindrales bacterium]|nr:SIS domain-containing protein [Candidatus Limnocylindrales bacterium]
MTKQAATSMPRWAEVLMSKYGISEVPPAGVVPDWLRAEVAQTPLWYIIREAKEVRRAHPYLLIEELRKQPTQWREIVSTMLPAIESVADALIERGTKEIIFIGCGSAFFTAMHGEFVVERLSGIRCRAVESFELLHYFPDVDLAHAVVVAHSGTGGSIETRDALQKARERGCLTLAIVNTPGSPLERLAEHSLCYETAQGCGPCISVISTRIVMQTLLGLELGRRLGRSATRIAEFQRQIERCSAIGKAFLSTQEDAVRSLAERYKDISSFFLVGTGPNYFSAREGTLKIEEESICVGKAYRPGDFHHDVISILGPTNCTIAIAGNETTNQRIADCLDVARAAESGTIAVVFDGNDSIANHAEYTIQLERGIDELLTPIPLTLVFQLFGYYRGIARGFNPDTLRSDHWPNAKAWMTAFPIGTH